MKKRKKEKTWTQSRLKLIKSKNVKIRKLVDKKCLKLRERQLKHKFLAIEDNKSLKEELLK